MSVTTGLGQLLQAAVIIACLIRQISASIDEQDASGLAPDAINFLKKQTYDYLFVSSAGLAPAVLTIANIVGSRFANRIWASWFLIQYLQAHSYRWNSNELCSFSSPIAFKFYTPKHLLIASLMNSFNYEANAKSLWKN